MSTFLTRHVAGSTGQSGVANENYLLMEVLSGANPVKGITLSYHVPGVNGAGTQFSYDLTDGATQVTPSVGDAYIVANWGVELRFRNDSSATGASDGTPISAADTGLANVSALNGIDLSGCLPQEWRAADGFLPMPGDLMIYNGSEWLNYTPQDGWTVTLAQDARETDICYNPVINETADGSTPDTTGDGYSNVHEVTSVSRGTKLTFKTAKTFNGGTQGYEDWLFLAPKAAASSGQPTSLSVTAETHSPNHTVTESTLTGRWTREAVIVTSAGYQPSDDTNYAISSLSDPGTGTTFDLEVNASDTGATVAPGDIISYAKNASGGSYETGDLMWTAIVLTATNTSGDNWDVTLAPARANYSHSVSNPYTGDELIDDRGFDVSASNKRGGTLLFSNNDLGLCDTGTIWYQVPSDGSGENYQCKNFYAKYRTWKNITSASGGGGGGSVNNAIKTVVDDDSGSFTASGEDTLNIVGLSGAGLATVVTQATSTLQITQTAASEDGGGYTPAAEFLATKAAQYWLDDPTVSGFGVTTPPGSPAEGSKYLVGSSPLGDWSGGSYSDTITVRVGSTWVVLAEVTHGLEVTLGSSVTPEGDYASLPSEFAGKRLAYDGAAGLWYPIKSVWSNTAHFTGKYQSVGASEKQVWAKCFQEQSIDTRTGAKPATSGTATNDGTFEVVAATAGDYEYDTLGIRHAIWRPSSNEFFLLFENQELRNTFFNVGNDQSPILDTAAGIAVNATSDSAAVASDTLPLDGTVVELTSAGLVSKGLSAYDTGSTVGMYWPSGTMLSATETVFDTLNTLDLTVTVQTSPDHRFAHGISSDSNYPRKVDAVYARGVIHFNMGGVLKLGGNEYITALFMNNSNVTMVYPDIGTGSSSQQFFVRIEYSPA